MHYTSPRMQYADREPIYHDHIPPPSSGHGFYEQHETMTLRWNSRVGVVYLDGAHVTHEVKMVGGTRCSLTPTGLNRAYLVYRYSLGRCRSTPGSPRLVSEPFSA